MLPCSAAARARSSLALSSASWASTGSAGSMVMVCVVMVVGAWLEWLFDGVEGDAGAVVVLLLGEGGVFCRGDEGGYEAGNAQA